MKLTLDPNKRYSYADYLTWLDGKRRELIDGAIYMVPPEIFAAHQKVMDNLLVVLRNTIEEHKKQGKVFAAPFDVRLPQNGETANDKIYNVVQPDVCVVCDLAKLDEQGCLGTPDLAIEVQAYTTARYDVTEKFDLYEASGVPEYWLICPYEKAVMAYRLQPNGKYEEGTPYYRSRPLPVQAFGGITIALSDIFKS
jgi:Uma2 family endonuclease